MDKKILDLLREDKEEIKKMLAEAIKEKHKKCAKPDGGFDYDKMSKMWHNGEW